MLAPVLARVALEHDLPVLVGRRAALALRLRLEGLRLRDIADATGYTVSGAHAAIERAKRRLRWTPTRCTTTYRG